MDSITKNGLERCGVCGTPWSEHPWDATTSTCARYRPRGATTEQAKEIARQDGLTVANVK